MSTEENKSWRPNWSNKLKLNHTSYDYVLITNAEYLDEDGYDNGDVNSYWVGQFHSVKLPDGSFRQWRSTDDPKHTLNMRLGVEDPRVGYPKNKFFFNCVHFDVHHLDEVKDAKGRVKTYTKGDRTGEPIKAWNPVKSIRKRDRLIKNPDEDTQFFRKKYIEAGPAHYDNLMNIVDKAKELCLCDGRLTISNYTCSNCGATMLDLDSDDLTPADIIRFGDNERRCSSCRHKDFPEAVYECDTCEDPRPHGFNQVVAKIRKQGTGPQTIIAVDSVISIKSFLMDNKEPIVEMDDDNNPIIEDGEFMLIEDLEFVADVPWDFDAGNPTPDSGTVSAFLGLEEGQEGYSNESKGYSKPKQSISRRRFR